MHRHPRISPAVYQVSITGPYAAKGPGDTPSRRRIFVCQPTDAGRGRSLCPADSRRADAPGLPAAGRPTRTCKSRWSSTGRRAQSGGLRRGHRDGAERGAGQSAVPVPRRAGSARTLRRARPTASATSQLASRLSFFLWSSIPDDELLDLADARRAQQARGARAAGAADAGRSAVAKPGEQLRRPVAAPAQPRGDHARPAPVPRLRRQPAAGLPAGDGAVLRERRARGSQRARSAEGATTRS